MKIKIEKPFHIFTKTDLQPISKEADLKNYSKSGLIIFLFPIEAEFINVKNHKKTKQILKFNQPIKYYLQKNLIKELNLTTRNITLKIKNGSSVDINVPIHTILKKQKVEPVIFEISQDFTVEKNNNEEEELIIEEEEELDLNHNEIEEEEEEYEKLDLNHMKSEVEAKTNSNEIVKLEKKIHQFEKILSIHSSLPEENSIQFIDEEEESEFHKNLVKIGEGSTSITYKFTDIRTKTPMCKKVILCKSEQLAFKNAQNALKEFEIMHKINHPCICKAIGINISEKIKNTNEKNEEEEEEEKTTIALFLEYVDFKLSDILKKKINETLKTRIVLDIVHAMNFLHKNGMMHRNLKIDNIMINAFYETKLVDFGLAKITELAIDGFSFTDDSLTKGIGSFAYMSPEMAKDEKYNNKTDVYSFGVILHFIFTGNVPKQSLREKINGKKINLPEPSKSISNFCIKLIDQCMSYSPSKRPSFEEILNQMRKNSYELASDVNSNILSKRDKELDFIENYK